MKPKTTELMKFQRLCRRLNESKRGVVGLLELLWNGTASNCPEGDIGRMSNEEIATLCDWPGDPDELVAALVETRWLDESPTYRLLVHDWPTHAPTYVHGNLRRWKRQFAKDAPNSSMRNGTQQIAEEPTKHVAKDATSSPCLTLPPPPPPTPSAPDAPAEARWAVVVGELSKAGMGRPQAAVKAAREHGCSSDDVLAILDHWRGSVPVWTPGALYDRIVEAVPGGNPREGWPPPLPRVANAAQSSADRERVAAKAAEDRDAAAERKNAAQAENERLEREHGPALDRMLPAKIRELFDRAFPAGYPARLKQLPQSGKVKHLGLRRDLLMQLDREATPAF